MWYCSRVIAKNALNQRQKEAVEHFEGPLLIVAGAGAGKTKTITHRIARLIERGVPAHNLLGITFTNKAAGEMRERVRRLLGERGSIPLLVTFHSLSVRLLREFGSRVEVPDRFVIWDRDDSLRAIKRTLRALGRERDNPRPLLAAISRAKAAGKTLEEYASDARGFWELDVADIWRGYDRELREALALDFDDLLLKARQLLRDHADVRALLQGRWTHITVDEYQDTSGVQFEITQLLAGMARNVCVVGDLDQSIYTWRQARLENLLSFEKHFSGTKVIRLEDNYRSSGTIIAAANSIIEKNRNRIPKRLSATREIGEPLYLFDARDEEDEAWFAALTSKALIEKRAIRPREIAVLFRTTAQSRAFENAFLQCGVPYKVIGTRFFERKEVKDALAYLRVALSEGDPLRATNRGDLTRILGVPSRGIGEATLSRALAGDESALPSSALAKLELFRSALLAMRQAQSTLSASEAVKFMLEYSGLERLYRDSRDPDDKERWSNLRELVNVAVRYDVESPPHGIELLLEEAALQSDQDEIKDEENRISLMTVHASKGLEFDTVFVTGLEQGLFPTLKMDENTDPEEERRLFYVALTRGKDRVFLSFARTRLMFGSRKPASSSEFLDDIDPRLVQHGTLEAANTYDEETIRY